MEQSKQYLYEYQNGKRARNLGFMKIEESMNRRVVHIYSNEIDDVEGIGEVRKKQIWKKYKTITNLRQATLEELKEILPTNVAENVLELIGQKQ